MTQHVLDRDMFKNSTSARGARLETPSTTGFPQGIHASSLIGRKLGTLFDVPRDRPDTIEALLRTLDQRFCR